MLGDEEEKKPGNSLNPLKKAMRRRNAKTVQFTAPSYVEPSDVEYSTDEEDEGDEEFVAHEEDSAAAQAHQQARDSEEDTAVEPLKARSQSGQQNGEAVIERRMGNEGLDQRATSEKSRPSDEIVDRSGRANTIIVGELQTC